MEFRSVLFRSVSTYHENIKDPTYVYTNTYIQQLKENEITCFSNLGIDARKLADLVKKDIEVIYPTEQETITYDKPLIIPCDPAVQLLDYYSAMIAINVIFGKILTLQEEAKTIIGTKVKDVNEDYFKDMLSVENLIRIDYAEIEKLRVISQFLSGIVPTIHEFVLPISVIHNFVSLIPDSMINELTIDKINALQEFLKGIDPASLLPQVQTTVYMLSRALPYTFKDDKLVKKKPYDENILEIGDQVEVTIVKYKNAYLITTQYPETYYILDNACLIADLALGLQNCKQLLRDLIDRGIYGNQPSVLMSQDVYDEIMTYEPREGVIFYYYEI
jgi:hypothetical protein